MYEDGVLTALIIYSVISNLWSLLVPAVVVIFIVWMVKKPRAQAAAQQFAGFPAGMTDLERLLQAFAQAQGNISPGERSQLTTAFLKAQNELNQLDALRRQQSELRLADMRGQAASMGIFID